MNNHTKEIVSCLLVLILLLGTESSASNKCKHNNLSTVSLLQTQVGGELKIRLHKNFDRLEEEKYHPSNVFWDDAKSKNWPGDHEGRTILGLVRDAQATGREPKYLKETIDLIPNYLNAKGYMGKMHAKGIMDEQQLAGNGWFIRGLIEYYKWKKDEKVLQYIKSNIDSLFIPGKGLYANYPIDPKLRSNRHGKASGSIYSTVNNWMLSTDIGCLFIGMDGAIHAYELLREQPLKEIIDEMVERFLKTDIIAIQAQTHATLTAMRGLMTYSELTGNKQLITEVEKRWELYKEYGMTENYANYNWFKRYDAWTEPCAIVDAYFVASELWETTKNQSYLADLDLIYYNALAHAQRENGGFGCDIFQRPDTNNLVVRIPEAHWCCTMRGADGLSKVDENSNFTEKNSLYIVHYSDNNAKLKVDKNTSVSINQKSKYPFAGEVEMQIADITRPKSFTIYLNALQVFSENVSISVNGKNEKVYIENGLYKLHRVWKKGDKIKFTFNLKTQVVSPQNKEKYSDNLRKVLIGPLLLGYSGTPNISLPSKIELNKIAPLIYKVKDTDIELSPVYHLMDKNVIKGDTYKKQILFY